jgi:hypothetical protein
MTTVAEGTQAMLERNQKMMDTATNAVRRAMRPAPARGRSSAARRSRRAR